VDKQSKEALKRKLSVILPELDERQRRILLAAEADTIGYGGIRILSKMSGVAESTILRGRSDTKKRPEDLVVVRRKGGGRKCATEMNPRLIEILQAIIEPETRGDPETPLRWTCKKYCQCFEKGEIIDQSSNCRHDIARS
jgi:hypothetical protein